MQVNWPSPTMLFSLISMCLSMGCGTGEEDFRTLGDEDDVANTAPADEHHHHDEGPHGGHILELGGLHGELAMDDSRGITLYLLGGDVETPAVVSDASAMLHVTVDDATVDLELAAVPAEGGQAGETSAFSIAGDLVPEAIHDIEDVIGTIDLRLGEEALTVEIEHDHDEHDHHGEHEDDHDSEGHHGDDDHDD